MSDDTSPAPEAPSEPSAQPYSPQPSAPAPEEPRAVYSGGWKESHPDAHSAAQEWARRRRENAQAPGEPDEPTIEVRYQDGRAADAAVDIKEAARDLSAFHQQTAPELPDDAPHYQDDREVTARTASEDLAAYRAQRAQALLAEMVGEQPEPQAPTVEQEQIDQVAAATPQQIMEEFERVASPALKQALQQEVAGAQQQISAQWQQAEQARNNYAVMLNALALNARGHALQDFADLQTAADIQQLSVKDPLRYQRYQAATRDLAQIHEEIGRVQRQQAEQFQENYRAWAQQQEQLAEQLIPEVNSSADPNSRRELQQAAHSVLKTAGFDDEALYRGWNNGEPFQLRDARVQAVIAKAAKYDLMMARSKDFATHAKPLPPVQKPGNGFQRSSSYDDVEALRSRLANSGSLKDAARLRAAQLASRRRG